MNRNLDPYLIELESKIQILEHENETLSAKAEENLLLNRAFEEINVLNNTDNLLLNTLESISVLLNIQFSGLFDYKANVFNCISSYALFSSKDTADIQFNVSEISEANIDSIKTCFLNKANNSFTFYYPNTHFIADNALIIALDSQIIKSRFFVFANDTNGEDLKGRIPLFQKIVRIISAKLERIYYQNELLKLNAKLEQKIELRTLELYNQNKEYLSLNEEYKIVNIDLVIAKEKAEESDRLKTAFLQNMSHEIRTPMNAIMGFSSLLSENFNNTEKLLQFSKIIEQRCSDLLDIINDILDVSKIESGQSTVNIEECNINELFTEIHLFFSDYQTRNYKQHINLIMPPSINETITIIKTDKVKLKQILINLISNAFKFTERGSIHYGCKQAGDKLQFHVSDTGIGIPKDKTDFIFERFAQIKNSSIQNIGGTGLGLPIVKGLAELLGGQVWLESERNQGTTFFFTIDYISGERANKVAFNGEIHDEIIINKTVLIVEDDLYNSMYLQEILKNHVARIYEVSNGVDAIKFVQNNTVDIILMDVRLPDISGYEATKKILKYNPDIKIIAQTAYAANDEYQKALSNGCVDYISKPTKQEQLLTILSKYL